MCTWQYGMLKVERCQVFSQFMGLRNLGWNTVREIPNPPKYSLTLYSFQVTASKGKLGPAIDQRSSADVLTPHVTELVNVASPILQPITFAHCFTLSGLWPVSFMHAGKTLLPANYLMGGFLQLQVHLSAWLFSLFLLLPPWCFTAPLYSITPTCPRYITYIVL